MHDRSCVGVTVVHGDPGLSFPRKRESTSWGMSYTTVSGFLLGAGMTESGQRLATRRKDATTIVHRPVSCLRAALALLRFACSASALPAFYMVESRSIPLWRDSMVDMPPQSGPDDEQLVLATLRGDVPSFGLLVERYWRMVSALALSRVRDSAQAEDIAQESFLKAYSQLHTRRGRTYRKTRRSRISLISHSARSGPVRMSDGGRSRRRPQAIILPMSIWTKPSMAWIRRSPTCGRGLTVPRSRMLVLGSTQTMGSRPGSTEYSSMPTTSAEGSRTSRTR